MAPQRHTRAEKLAILDRLADAKPKDRRVIIEAWAKDNGLSLTSAQTSLSRWRRQLNHYSYRPVDQRHPGAAAPQTRPEELLTRAEVAAELMSPADLAQHLGVSRPVVSNWQARGVEMPEPLTRIAGGATPVWLRRDVVAWEGAEPVAPLPAPLPNADELYHRPTSELLALIEAAAEAMRRQREALAATGLALEDA